MHVINFITVGARPCDRPHRLVRRIAFYLAGLLARWGRTQGAPLQWIRVNHVAYETLVIKVIKHPPPGGGLVGIFIQ